MRQENPRVVTRGIILGKKRSEKFYKLFDLYFVICML